MKYFEFGKENPTTLLLLHGVNTTWQLSFQAFIEVAEKKYHVIAVAEDGSVLNECERGVVNRKRIWWTQAESIIGFVNYYEKHKDEKYLEAADKVWNFCEKYFLDRRAGGEWFSELNDDLTPDLTKNIVDIWKCPYHTSRMCMEVINRLAK